MSTLDPAATPTWTATQQWLDDLDRDELAPPEPVDIHLDAGENDLAPDLDTGDIDTDADIDHSPPQPNPFERTPDRPDSINAEPPRGTTDTTTADITTTIEDDPPRLNKPLAIGFIAATAVATIAVTATLLGMRQDPRPQDDAATPATQISVAAALPAPTPPVDVTADRPIPFTATASCPPGSTAAQTVAGTDPTQAWVCVRSGADGQTLDIDLGRPMVVTALSITPGWVGADASGADQWLQHRVVTRVQWNLFNGDTAPAAIVSQNTGNVRGEAIQPLPDGGVLASRITMIVLQTSRAPADTTPTTSAPPAPGGVLDDVLGAPLGPLPTPIIDTAPPMPSLPGQRDRIDPADNTFAVSAITVIGHPPK